LGSKCGLLPNGSEINEAPTPNGIRRSAAVLATLIAERDDFGVSRAEREQMRQDVDLVERSDELSVLADCLADVTEHARGRLVLLRGEAGVGKTSLLRHFCATCPTRVRILWAGCDALFTPRPLGPLLDVARTTGGQLQKLVESSAAPHDVAAALLEELRSSAPTVLVLEDLHWADEATLDVVRLMSRRSEAVPALVLASYRDETLGPSYLLRLVLGEIPARGSVVRLSLDCLTRDAVHELADSSGVNGDELYDTTGGNPFFVTEALAARTERVPATVRDAVQARAARLTPPARALLDAVAIAPQRTELWLLEALVDAPPDALAECLGSGVLVVDATGVAFRHELARLAIEDSLALGQRLALHRRALAALAKPPAAERDLARLAHHAEAAADGSAVLEFAPAAAARASAVGAHRESAAQYARTLRFADPLPAAERATLLARYGDECMLTDQTDEALRAVHEAIALHRSLHDVDAEARDQRLLAATLWCPGRTAAAREAARAAVTLLEKLEPGRELAGACTSLAMVSADTEDYEEALRWGTRGLDLAREFEQTMTAANALAAIGTVRFLRDEPEGIAQLEQAVALARDGGHVYEAVTASIDLVKAATRLRRYELARTYLDPALALAEEHGVDLLARYLLAYRAQVELGLGDWSGAVDTAETVIREPRRSIIPRIIASTVIGLVRARRGDPEVWSSLDQALELAQPSDELQAIAPVAIARAEAAWLTGQPASAAEITARTLALAIRRHATWVIAELVYWRRQLGLPAEELPSDIATTPFGLSIAGDWKRAAHAWGEIGSPYERALALADSGEEMGLREAHEQLRALGATPAAAIVARRLREKGARGVPRGPRAATRENPAGLTARELDVLSLLAEGLRNADIAKRLVVARKTVDHHVSAILRKLDVKTRGEAAAAAQRLELLAKGHH
jgi:DNA-binding CsgD family transcriptional regulator/tetratricopeptide (TPR) repeat protein